MAASDCPFCQKVAALKENPAPETVWEFPHSVAILGTWQYYTGYCILIARRHATELSQLSDLERHAFLNEMCLLAKAIEEQHRPHKLNYELLGNQVPHLHWHLFPRAVDDPDRLKPVWLSLDLAERDSEMRRRLENGSLDRYITAAGLQAALKRLNAPHL
jgi:diadenosine tetraphosphate (Ap4A) HIT family hydrolase